MHYPRHFMTSVRQSSLPTRSRYSRVDLKTPHLLTQHIRPKTTDLKHSSAQPLFKPPHNAPLIDRCKKDHPVTIRALFPFASPS